MRPRFPVRTDTRRNWQDAALVIPVFAAVLIMPLFLNPLAGQGVVFGLPVEVAYLFAIWAALVASGAILSRRLPHQLDPRDEAEAEDAQQAED